MTANHPAAAYNEPIALVESVRDRFFDEGRRATQSTIALRCLLDARDAQSLDAAHAYARDAVAALRGSQVRTPSGKRNLQPESTRALDLLLALFPTLER